MLSMLEIEKLRSEYPEGCRVVLNSMDDFYAPPEGTKGSVLMVDDRGQIHVKWDNGSTLAVVPEVDSISKI